ncbi:M28 family peptidase [Flavisolibacter sp. BT320]|nr:M28 family peptidase [Flavisolibacter longurius]
MKRSYYLLFLFLGGCASQQKAATDAAPSVANLQSHVQYLASDNLQGRRTGTQGEALAADYIATAFEKAGLQPKGTAGYFQAFPVSEGREVAGNTALRINDAPLTLHTDFFPMVYSGNGSIDATASVSLLEKGEPWFVDIADILRQQKTNPHMDVPGAILKEAKEAVTKGATALFLYNSSTAEDGLRFDGKGSEALSIPVFFLTKKATATYLKDPSALLKIQGTAALQTSSRSGKNVVGYLDNGAPTTIVIGAHYDHLGFGEDQNSRHTGSDAQIHNGADDNASGTAALIELARLLKSSRLKANNYLFIAFSGEELGLFGSKYFTQHPTVDLASINFMINMDMVGRLNDSTRALTVGGYGTSPVWGQLYNRQGQEALYAAGTYRFDSSGTGPSDHTSFYQKNIPVLFYFTGLHTDYHRPSDDADRINYTGQAAIVQHIYSLLQAANGLQGKVPFTKTREVQMGTSARFSVSLGIMPDYTYGGAGVRVDGVSEGRAAQKAGLKEGDVITALGEFPVSSVESYMQALARFKKGDTTTVRYTRDGKSFETTAAFQ